MAAEPRVASLHPGYLLRQGRARGARGPRRRPRSGDLAAGVV